MKVRIESDGTPLNTKVIDSESGEPLKGCYKFEVHGSCDTVVVATVWTRDTSNIITCDADLVNVPVWGCKSEPQRLLFAPTIQPFMMPSLHCWGTFQNSTNDSR